MSLCHKSDTVKSTKKKRSKKSPCDMSMVDDAIATIDFDKLKAAQNKLTNSFYTLSDWSSRPDIVLLFQMLILVGICAATAFSMYKIGNTSSTKLYTEEQFRNAQNNMNQTWYSAKELAAIKKELAAVTNHDEYFASKTKPYSLENSGYYDLQRGGVAWLLISWFIVHVLPFLIVLYIIWFIQTFKEYIMDAIKGFFMMIQKYIRDLFSCMFKKKVKGAVEDVISTLNPFD